MSISTAPDPALAQVRNSSIDAVTVENLLLAAAHDLRTPLNAMSGWLHLLGNVTSAPSPLFDKAKLGIARAVQQQTALLEQIFETVLATRGELTLHLEAVDFRDMLERVFAARTPQSGDPMVGPQWVVQLDAALPVCIDRVHCETALGEISATIRRSVHNAQTAYVTAKINDQTITVTIHVVDVQGAQQDLANAFPQTTSKHGVHGPSIQQLHANALINAQGGRVSLSQGPDLRAELLQIQLPLNTVR